MNNTLKVLPLGGFDEVGANALIYETEHDLILVDCGIAFPATDLLGVRALSPNPQYILSRKEKFRGYLITHGHEDHIGALLYWRELIDGPIYGTALVRELLTRRYEEREQVLHNFNEIGPGSRLNLGDLGIEALHITHSIPESLAFSIEAAGMRVLHTGDFKLDPTPISKRPTELKRFQELGELGIDAMIADSTNASRSGRTPSESDVAKALLKVIGDAPQRVVLTTFPTNLERVRSTIDAAIACDRSVIPLGRSAEKMIEIGQDLGYLPEDAPLASRHDLSWLSPEKQLILAAGCQADPRSTMTRIASSQHPQLSLESGDTVIYSARKIPGNERNIAKMFDQLLEQGVDIVDERSACVHTSGHAQHDELLELYSLVQPTLAIPGLGSRMLRQLHANLLMDHGREPGDIVMLENGLGAVLSLDEKGEVDYRLTAPVSTELCALEGQGYKVDEALLDERQRLATDGILSISLSLSESLDRVGPVRIAEAGLHPERYDEVLEEAVVARLERAVDSFPTSKGPKTPHAIERLLVKAASSELRRARLRPLILVHLHY